MSDNRILFSIGQTIKALRNERGWSQEQLSEKNGVDRSFLGKIERGEVNVSILTLCDIAKALSVNFQTLINFQHEAQSSVDNHRK